MPRTTRQAIEAPKKCKAMSTRNSPQTPCKHNAKINGFCIQHYNVHCKQHAGVRKRSAERPRVNTKALRPQTPSQKPLRTLRPRIVREIPAAPTTQRNAAVLHDDPDITLSCDSNDSDDSNIDDSDDGVNSDENSIEALNDPSVDESDEIVEYVDETSDDPLDTLADNVAVARRQLDKIEEIVSDIRKIMKFSKELAHPPAVLTASIEQSRAGLSNDIRELQRTVALMQ